MHALVEGKRIKDISTIPLNLSIVQAFSGEITWFHNSVSRWEQEYKLIVASIIESICGTEKIGKRYAVMFACIRWV